MGKTLKDKVAEHINKTLVQENGKYFLGSLTDYGSQNTEDQPAILLTRNIERISSHSGYLHSFPKQNKNTVSYITDKETFYFTFRPKLFKVTIQEPQITRDVPKLRQAIKKEDWVTPEPLRMGIKGNYAVQIREIQLALRDFKKQGFSELWVSPFF